MKKKNLIKLIGILAFAWILYSIDLTKLGESLLGMNLYYLIGILPLFFLLIYVKTLRWSVILRERNIHLPISGLYVSYMAGYFVGGVTPGRIGELLKYKYVRDSGNGVGISIGSTIGDRLWDITFLVVIGLLGFPIVYPLSEGQQIATLVSIFVAIISVVLFLKNKKIILIAVGKKLLKFVPEKHQEKIKAESSQFMDVILPGNMMEFSKLMYYTVISWLIYFLRIYLLSLSLGLEIEILHLSIVLAVTALFGLLPISIAGIGTRDASLIFLLAPYGINSERAVAFSLSILAVFILELGIGFLFWISQKKRSMKYNLN